MKVRDVSSDAPFDDFVLEEGTVITWREGGILREEFRRVGSLRHGIIAAMTYGELGAI
jgi:hypothetical protein